MAPGSDPAPGPTVLRVTVDDSSRWVHQALDDFERAPVSSLVYGAAFVVLSWTVVSFVLFSGMGSVVLPLASGFMLVGSMFAVPLHVLSRAHENGEHIDLIEAVRRSRASIPGLAVVGVAVTLIMMTWMLLALLIFAGFYGESPPSLTNFTIALLGSPQAALFLTTGTLVGAVMAAVAFAVTFLSIPILVDRPDTLPYHAMAVSMRAVARQPGVLIGWGATLGFITLSGMIPAFLGLAVTVPLAGYASWHAYRAMLPRARHG
ncbi:DUF2189 domain-containing protein [Roseospira visakhapatnamensis]|uniref:Putative membrane protein n=1 Tax=Roseospira visakhapatnamensis TaxID=390880 RepID=A0A7W6RG48_9PROT|nr:DUF2189 domain-containing protein [Roseospira visakhapatnamensis]MBB4267817.1 putative membrane protein [Roseospira visakhapatnamensis]